MDSLYPYFSQGAWHIASWDYLTHLLFLGILFLGYTLSDYRRAIVPALLFIAGTVLGALLSTGGIFTLRPSTAVFCLPCITAALAVFNIFGAANKPSSLLEKTGYIAAIAFSLIFGLSSGTGAAAGFGASAAFLAGLAAGTLAVALIVLCITTLTAFFNVNRRDFVLVVSSVTIGIMIPYLVRYFPFALR